MATDPRKLRPSELCRLLNSTALGEVINERQLHGHRTAAGVRNGDARYIDLLRYFAWLVEIRHEPKRADAQRQENSNGDQKWRWSLAVASDRLLGTSARRWRPALIVRLYALTVDDGS